MCEMNTEEAFCDLGELTRSLKAISFPESKPAFKQYSLSLSLLLVRVVVAGMVGGALSLDRALNNCQGCSPCHLSCLPWALWQNAKLQALLLNHPSSPSRCIYCHSPWLTIRLGSWAPEYQYGSDSAGPLGSIYQANRISLLMVTCRHWGDHCKHGEKTLSSTKRQFDSLQNEIRKALHLRQLSAALDLLRETDESIEGPSVGGEEKRNSNSFVFHRLRCPQRCLGVGGGGRDCKD